jgi:seryl-tRNA synthetase
MSDTIQNNTGNSQGNIMKELSDIKTSLAVNTSETQNIKDTINEVKSDVKEMKKNYINQEQHNELIKRVSALEDKTEAQENSTTTLRVMITIGIGILTLLTSVLIYHVVK